MKIYYVDREHQGPETEDPLLLDGEHKTWDIQSTIHHGDFGVRGNCTEKPYKNTLQGWFNHLRTYRPYIKTLFIYDVQAIEGVFCDQGCKPNVGQGCRSKYLEDNFKTLISFDWEIDVEAKEVYMAECREENRIDKMKKYFKDQLENPEIVTPELWDIIKGQTYHNGEPIKLGDEFLEAIVILGEPIYSEKGLETPVDLIKIKEEHLTLYEIENGETKIPMIKLK